MDEIKRGQNVMRNKDGLRMKCWGFDPQTQAYRCSWYEGLNEKWGTFPKGAIHLLLSEVVEPTGAATDWRTVMW